MPAARSVFIALLLMVAPIAARADERILQFRSEVAIQPDSALEVVETIDVRAEGDAIKHGIYRDFPTRYRGPHGTQFRVGFTFEGATLDGATVDASTSPFSNGVRIKIGDPDTLLASGTHRYVLRYRTTRQIGRFKNYDELYWNATGNGWPFAIDVAEARIRLPRPANWGQRAVYTGAAGSGEHFAEVVDEKPGEIAFRTTRPLGPNEGLTVAPSFPKGVVAEADENTRLGWWLSDYGPTAVGVAALLGLLGYYFVAWTRAGRDPHAGTVVPLFSPPDDLSPAAMRYIVKMGSDNRAFAAALVDMGVRGHIRLSEEDGGFFSKDKTRLERLAASTPLPPEEEDALRKLAMTGETIMMVQKNHEKFSAAQSSLTEALKEQYQGRLFNKNWGWAIAGAVLLVAAVWVAAAAVVASYGLSDLMMVGTSVGLFALAAVLILLIHQFRTAGKCFLTILAFIVGATALVLGAPMIPLALESGWWLPVALPLLSLPFVVSAFAWIDAPTVEGRGVLDRIAGFKQYLSITERERLDRMTAPQDTPEIFEKYLPYAIALGVENRWADRFAGVLAAAAAQGRQGFTWYAGSSDPWNNPGRFTESLGSDLTSTISSASSAPGSSSGSGGGGSSGGGGGGGGGGGW